MRATWQPYVKRPIGCSAQSAQTGQRRRRRAVAAARLEPGPCARPPLPQRRRARERPGQGASRCTPTPRPATPTSSGTRRRPLAEQLDGPAREPRPASWPRRADAGRLVAHGRAAQRRHGPAARIPFRRLDRGRAAPRGPGRRLRAGGPARRVRRPRDRLPRRSGSAATRGRAHAAWPPTTAGSGPRAAARTASPVAVTRPGAALLGWLSGRRDGVRGLHRPDGGPLARTPPL